MNSFQSAKHSVAITLCSALLLTQGIPAVSQTQDRALRSFLPQSKDLRGWIQTDSVKEYAGEDLFSLIDGGAVLFFEYGFDKALSATYENGSGSSISLEIYRMKDAGAAYGIYSVRSGDRGASVPIGREGSRHADYIVSWKGKYYVSVAGSDSSRQCSIAMENAATAVVLALPDTGTKPLLLEVLPRERLLKTWYVRGSLSLSTILPVLAEEMGGLSVGVAGKYEDRTLLLLQYPGPQQSEHAMQEIQLGMKNAKRFSNYRSDGTITLANRRDGHVFCFARTGSSIIGAVSADESVAVNSVKALQHSHKSPH